MALVNFNVSSLRNSKSSQCFSMNWIVEAFVPFVEVDDFCYLPDCTFGPVRCASGLNLLTTARPLENPLNVLYWLGPACEPGTD